MPNGSAAALRQGWQAALRSWLPPGLIADHPIDGTENAALRAAATEMTLVKRFADLLAAGRRRALDQSRHRHDDAVVSLAALRSLLIKEGLLHLARQAVVQQAFDGDDVVTIDGVKRRRARLYRPTVLQHGTRAAIALRTADTGAFPVEILWKRRQQCQLRRCLHIHGVAVNVERPCYLVRLFRRLHVADPWLVGVVDAQVLGDQVPVAA